MHLLVHACCAPDAVYFIKRLREDYPQAKMMIFFYDPNIHPYEEYKLRMIETKRVCQELGVDFLEGEYHVENWLGAVKGLEDEPERGKRCKVCFDFRLKRSALLAKELGATHMTTTLLMSPKKDLKVLTQVGDSVCKPLGIEFVSVNYRKGGGTQEMFKLSKEFQIYHQDYCGCVYGLFKQKKEEAVWDLLAYKGRRPGSKEEWYFIKLVRTYAESLSLPCREWEFNFLNWIPIHGKVEVEGRAIPSYIVPYSGSIKGVLKADPEDMVGDTIYYNKQGLKIILVEPFRDRPLERVRFESSPAFLIPSEYRELLLSKRIGAVLETKVFHDRSLVLLVGGLSAKRILSAPADTTQDGEGLSFEHLKTFLDKNAEEILKGSLSLLLAGAESLGRIGSSYFRERTGRELYELTSFNLSLTLELL